VKWKHAPPSVNPKLETGSTTILYFGENGRFASIGCVVNRIPGQYTAVSAGDGQVVSLGKWDGHLPGAVRHRLVSRTVALIGEELPGPWFEDKLTPAKDGHLLFRGQIYYRNNDLDLSIREYLPDDLKTGAH
jgi:hypothetical protein